MQVQLLVERDQNECIVKLAGTAYKFKRNEHGHLVSDITDQEHIKWVSDPMHNTSFKPYSAPKQKVFEGPVKVVEKPESVAEPEVELIIDVVEDAESVGTVEWLCEICGKPFLSQRSLKGHMGGAHKKEQS